MKKKIQLIALAAILSTPLSYADPGSEENVHEESLGPEEIHRNCYAYSYGEGVEIDYSEAFVWCQRGADLEIPSSITLLAEMYRHGLFVDPNNDRARELYLQAAELGHVHAQYMVGHLALILASSEEDVELTCRWLTRAASQGYERARTELAELERLYRESQPEVENAVFCDGYD